MKKITAVLIALLLFLAAGCGQSAPVSESAAESVSEIPAATESAAPSQAESDGSSTDAGEKLNIVCTIFPQYDWVRMIADGGADIELTLLLKNEVDIHSFQPSVDDIVKVSTSDLFIYVGGESDAWVADALKEAANPDMVVINMLEAVGDSARAEEIVEGMQDDEDHDHGGEAHEEEAEHLDEGDHDHEGEEAKHPDKDEHAHENEEAEHLDDDAHDHEGEAVMDEHVWLSLRTAEIICAKIADALSSIDAGNAGRYKANADAYIEELGTVDGLYQEVIGAAPVKTLLFGDRFPFRYLVDDYGINYYAAFPGCSAETEASFETIVFLANKTDELGLKNIMTLESSDQSIAKTIRDNTSAKDQKILTLDSMQSVTEEDVAAGGSYLKYMENNLMIIMEALE